MLKQLVRFPMIGSLRFTSTSASNLKSSLVQDEQNPPKKDYLKQRYILQEADQSKPSGWDSAKPFESIPGPKPWPWFGNTWRMIFGELSDKDLYQIHRHCYEKYGKICVLRNIINDNWLFIFAAEDAENVFRNEGVWPKRDAADILKHYRKTLRRDLFGEITGLPTEQGENWHKLRSIVNPILLQPRVTIQYVKSIDIVAQEFVERMRMLAASDPKRQMPNTFKNELNKWALESVTVISIAKRLGCLSPSPNEEVQRIISSMGKIEDLSFELDYQASFWKQFSTPNFRRYVEEMDFVSGVFKRYIDEANEEIRKSPVGKSEDQQSALEKLLKIDKQIAFTMVIDMLMAGIDTTGNATGALFYYLAKNPRVQNELRAEVLKILPKKDSPITKESLLEARYLKAVIKESTRLAPISAGNARRTQKDLVVRGYQVPKGTQIILGNLVMSMRDFHRPNEFLPERWLRTTQGELSYKNVNPFTCLPFGFGPRSCVGKRLANLEIETLTAKVIRNFKLEWHHPDLTFKQRFLYGYVEPLKLTVLEVDS